MIFITSDTHFGHNKSFLFEPRGFSTIAKHDKGVIENWNSIVQPDDIVYHLGDVMLGDNEYGLECLKQLNGQIKLIRGNHDSDVRWKIYNELPNVELLGWSTMIKYRKYYFYLSHFPTLCSNYDTDKLLRTKIINLCGHSHTKEPLNNIENGIIYHCELDANDNKPVLLDNIIERLQKYYGIT